MTPALTPQCAVEVVDMMIEAGELLARDVAPVSGGGPPALLLRAEAAAAAAAAAAEPPVRHLFAPPNPRLWPH